MDPNAKRSALRKRILSEVAQHPATLVPFCVAVLGAVYSAVISLSLGSAAAIIGGATMAIVGGLYNILIRGEQIRDVILTKWKKEEEAAFRTRVDKVTSQVRQYLPEALTSLWNDMMIAHERAKTALAGQSQTSQAYLGPQLDQNFDEAVMLAERAVEISMRLAGAASGGKLAKQLALERHQIGEHFRQLIANYDSVADELKMIDDNAELGEASRKLKELERSISASRKVQDFLKPPDAADDKEYG